MDCLEISKRATDLVGELKLIFRWDENSHVAREHDLVGGIARKMRRDAIIAELCSLRRECGQKSRPIDGQNCALKGFFGRDVCGRSEADLAEAWSEQLKHGI